MDTIVNYSKWLLAYQPYLVTSNGELLIVYNIVRNRALWSNVVFKKEVIFHEFDLETSDLEFEVSKSSIWKHTSSCFFFHTNSYLTTPVDQSSSNFHRFVIWCVCWDKTLDTIGNCQRPVFSLGVTPSENTGLWQLPKVSNVFKTLTEEATLILLFPLLLFCHSMPKLFRLGLDWMVWHLTQW